MGRLNERVAVITGASSGIGKATAELFAKEGAIVVGVARREALLNQLAEEITRDGGKVLMIPADITGEEQCKNIVERTIREYGKIDVLVNNAGILDNLMPAVKVSNELWQKVVDINQTSVFMLSRETLKHMTKEKSGSIINVASVAAIDATSGFSYSTTKFAVIGMTKNIAIQYAGTGIRCNAICPGHTPTELNSEEKMAEFDNEFKEIAARHNDFNVGFSDVLDQANAILFFANDESRYITGQVLVVDRGFSL